MPDPNPSPATLPGDRAARRSAWIAILAISGGALILIITKTIADSLDARGTDPGDMPNIICLATFAAAWLASIWGTLQALHALRRGTTLRGYAQLGLVLNALVAAAGTVLLLIGILGVALWSTMGR